MYLLNCFTTMTDHSVDIANIAGYTHRYSEARWCVVMGYCMEWYGAVRYGMAWFG